LRKALLSLFLISFFVSPVVVSQVPSSCNIPTALQNAYKTDVASLTLSRVFALNKPSKDSIDIDQAEMDTIWKGLAAIYNATAIPERDSIFNIYCLHIQDGYEYISQAISVYVDTSFSWTDPWMNHQVITGYAQLDSFMTHYEFINDGQMLHRVVFFHTDQLINTVAFADSLESFSGIIYAQSSPNGGDGNRITYSKSGNYLYYDFSLGWGDCPSGCIGRHYWHFRVNLNDCSVLLTGTSGANIPVSGSDIPHVLNCNLSALNVICSVKSNVSCYSGNNGFVCATPSNGTSPYSFLWSNNATDSCISNLTAGTYCVTVTDDFGDIGSACATVSQPAQLYIIFINQSNVICNGMSNGSVCAHAYGGVQPYTYTWSNAATTACINNLSIGTYCVTTTDANGCSASACVIITEPPPFVVTSCTVLSNVSCFGGNNGTICANVTGGTPPYDYLWNNMSYTHTNATTNCINNLMSGFYCVTVTDYNGCTAGCCTTISEPPQLVATCITQSNVTCHGGNNGSVCVSPSGGTPPYTWVWNNLATTGCINNLTTGTYCATVTDSQGCTTSCCTTITEPPPLAVNCTVQSNVSCYGGNDGEICASASGGTAPYTFIWSNGNTSSCWDNLSVGNYCVTITDSHGCTASCCATINQPALLTVSCTPWTDVSCFGGYNGQLCANAQGGTPPYIYLWSSGGNASCENGLLVGNYCVTVTDANGCTASCCRTISQPPLLTATCSVQSNVSCFGGNDGSACFSSSGGVLPYNYQWSNGATTGCINNLIAVTYCVTVTDSHGCTATCCANISQPPQLTANITIQPVLCSGGNTGLASVNPTGGTSPYDILWSTGGSTNIISGLAPGIYSVTVTDDNSCTVADTFSILQQLLTIIPNVTQISCNGSEDGSISVSLINGTPPFIYTWTPNVSNTAIADSLPQGTYIINVVDSSGCTASDTITITNPPLLEVLCSVQSNVTCHGNCDGEISAIAQGGTPPYMYLWSNGAIGPTTGACVGTYCVTVTDLYGCTASCCATITEPPPLFVDIGSDTIVCNDANYELCGEGDFISWLWSTGETDSCIIADTTGVYSLIVTDGQGCNSYDTVSIVIDNCTSIEEFNGGYGIFPNPAGNGYFRVVIPPSLGTADLYVYDITGRMVIQQKVGNEEIVDVSFLAPGMYLLKLDQKFNARLMVE
jgi:hypothetical protein